MHAPLSALTESAPCTSFAPQVADRLNKSKSGRDASPASPGRPGAYAAVGQLPPGAVLVTGRRGVATLEDVVSEWWDSNRLGRLFFALLGYLSIVMPIIHALIPLMLSSHAFLSRHRTPILPSTCVLTCVYAIPCGRWTARRSTTTPSCWLWAFHTCKLRGCCVLGPTREKTGRGRGAGSRSDPTTLRSCPRRGSQPTVRQRARWRAVVPMVRMETVRASLCPPAALPALRAVVLAR